MLSQLFSSLGSLWVFATVLALGLTLLVIDAFVSILARKQRCGPSKVSWDGLLGAAAVLELLLYGGSNTITSVIIGWVWIVQLLKFGWVHAHWFDLVNCFANCHRTHAKPSVRGNSISEILNRKILTTM